MKQPYKYFFLGLSLGAALGFIPFIKSGLHNHHASAIDTCVAQLLHEEMRSYKKDVNFDAVVSAMYEFEMGKRPLKDRHELYAVINEVHAKKAEKEALDALAHVEGELAELQQKPNMISILDGRVYVEILELGLGEEISLEDTIALKYINHTRYGNHPEELNSNEVFTIPLSRTIKGFQLGMKGAKIGEKRRMYIHPELGFGNMGYVGPNCLLIFEVTLLEKEPQIENTEENPQRK